MTPSMRINVVKFYFLSAGNKDCKQSQKKNGKRQRTDARLISLNYKIILFTRVNLRGTEQRI